MGNLVGCKTCGRNVDKSAKICPNCGVSNPGVNREAAQGCLGLVLLVFIVGGFIGINSEAPEEHENNIQEVVQNSTVSDAVSSNSSAVSANNSENQDKLTDKNINQFLVKYSNDYITHVMKLIEGFEKYKVNNDYQGFVAFKNNEWLPDYERDRAIYNGVLEANRKYLFDNGMTWLFSQFVDLSNYANDFFFDLRRGDKSIRKKTAERLKNDTDNLQALFKEKGIEFSPVMKTATP